MPKQFTHRVFSSKAFIYAVWALLICLLIYSRTVNLGWGLPYPMHPDERNMVDAILKLHCDDPREFVRDFTAAVVTTVTRPSQNTFAPLGPKPTCMNPEFFAYGQFTLYLAYGIGRVLMNVSSPRGATAYMTFDQAAIALRLISAFASIFTVWYMVRIVRLIRGRLTTRDAIITMLMATWVPVAIQFAHFGTTESLLALLYTILVAWSLEIIQRGRVTWRDVVAMGAVIGISLGVKISAVTYLAIPFFTLGYLSCIKIARVFHAQTQVVKLTTDEASPNEPSVADMLSRVVRSSHTKGIVARMALLAALCGLAVGVCAILASPYNLISASDLRGSMAYESSVGVGQYIPFYTRQFLLEVPILFQMRRIFPYALGSPLWIGALLGLFVLSWKSRLMNTLRFSALVILISNGYLYAKWTRFLAPMYPLMTIMGVCMILAVVHARWFTRISHRLKIQTPLIVVIILWVILPGLAYVSIYSSLDVRYAASQWMYAHVPSGSRILSETANVVDLPVGDDATQAMRPLNYNIQNISFDFYQLDTSTGLQSDLTQDLASADYIIIPSRRIFYNHTCREEVESPSGLSSPSGHTVGSGNLTTTRHSPEKCAYLKQTYPQLDHYYDDLFSGKSGFVKVAEFSSYPRISLGRYGGIILPDEEAEETFTVFDHPVIRIYKRITQSLMPHRP